MADYLDRIGAGKILIDKDPFSFDWMPPRIVGRDEELNEKREEKFRAQTEKL